MPTRSSARDTSSEERASGEEAAPSEKPSTENNALLAEDEVDDSDEDKPKKGGNQGRRKIDIEFIEDKNKRHITFSKRKAGIMKKAYELSTLTGTQVLLLVVSETGLVYTYTTPKLSKLVMAREGKNLIQKCLTNDDGKSPDEDYPDPKVKHYAPRGQKPTPIPLPPSPKRPQVPVTAAHDPLPTSIPPRSATPVSAVPYTGSIAPVSYAPMSQNVGMTTAGMHHPTVAQQPVSSTYQYPSTYAPSNGMQGYGSPYPAQSEYSYVPLPPMPTPGPMSSPQQAHPTLKKRKTVDNIKKLSHKDERAAKQAEASEAAARTLENARHVPTIENLLRAFTMQDEASKKTRDEGVFERGVSSTMTELHMAINHNLLLPSGSVPDLAMSSPVERIDTLYQYFFRSYIFSKPDLDRKELQNYAADLIALAGWLLGHGFITHVTHIALARHCATAKLQTKNSSPSRSPTRNPTLSRQKRADQMLADYCVFASERYKNHWEQSVTPLTGHFHVLSVSDTYLILDEPLMEGAQDYISSLAPFKLRMPMCLNVLLRRGDSIHVTIKKAQGSSFWLPTASGEITPAPEDAHQPEYDPRPDLHRYEMEQCQANENQIGFNIAYSAYQKATRGDQLLSMGEFDDEGFRPREVEG